MPSLPNEDDELRKAIAEAEAAEAALRHMKEGLVPRDRVDALNALMRAELRAMVLRETGNFRVALISASTQEEARAVLSEMAESIVAGTERIKEEMLSQMNAWTIAGIEDRAREDEC